MGRHRPKEAEFQGRHKCLHKEEPEVLQMVDQYQVEQAVQQEGTEIYSDSSSWRSNIHRGRADHSDELEWNRLLCQGSPLPRCSLCLQCAAGCHLLFHQCCASVPIVQQRQLEGLGGWGS